MDEQPTPAGATGTTGGARGVPGGGGDAPRGDHHVPEAGARPAPRPARRPSRRPALRPRGPWGGLPTAVLAAVTLVGAFALAQGTGVRALGGLVLVVGVVWCAWRSLPAAGVGRVAAVVALGAVCFVAAHVLAPHLGAWPSVALVAVVLGAGTWGLVDRRPPA